MKYIVMTAMIAALAYGFVPESFRMQSTGGIWEDDYDLIFDPTRLTEIKGSRVYTGLSNYVTGDERQFNFDASDFFLVGGSSKLGKSVYPAGVFDRYAVNLPQFTGLVDQRTGDSLFGTAHVDSVAWLDPDTNGTYDFKQVRRTDRNAWESGNTDDLFLGVGMQTRTARFGIAVAFNDSCHRTTDPLLDFVHYDYDSSLFSGQLTYLSHDTSRYAGQATSSTERLILSGRFDLKNDAQLAVMVEPALVGSGSAFYRNNNLYADYSPANPAIKDYTIWSECDSLRLPYQGVDVPVSLQWVKFRPGRGETRITATGFFDRQAVGDNARYRYATYSEFTLNPGLMVTGDTQLRRERGLTTGTGASAALVDRHWIGERFNLGWGLNVGFRMRADSLFDSTGWRSVSRLDNGDSLLNHGDYVQTTTRAESWLHRTVGNHIALAIPVGLEFRVVPAVALRLGAIQNFDWDNSIATNQLQSLSPSWTRIDYGDGTFYESWDTPQLNPTSSETKQVFSQTTTFTYGAGFQPVENLQIDLMGFAHLTNLANWRLSATFRF